jgi:hypothetical protein
LVGILMLISSLGMFALSALIDDPDFIVPARNGGPPVVP